LNEWSGIFLSELLGFEQFEPKIRHHKVIIRPSFPLALNKEGNLTDFRPGNVILPEDLIYAQKTGTIYMYFCSHQRVAFTNRLKVKNKIFREIHTDPYITGITNTHWDLYFG
jgi:hypothetical protein